MSAIIPHDKSYTSPFKSDSIKFNINHSENTQWNFNYNSISGHWFSKIPENRDIDFQDKPIQSKLLQQLISNN
jgi:hypothetical protein